MAGIDNHPIYASAQFWRDPKTNKLWHALRGHPNTRELVMSAIGDADARKTLAWCRRFNMTVEGAELVPPA